MEIYLELTQEQWTEVLDKASKNDAAMFILRCWANSQSVSSGAVNAFKKNVVTSDEDRRNASTVIGNITTWVHQVTGSTDGVCYTWNKIEGTWNIGYFQTANLREAMGVPADF
tara:strand:+ start:52 stop:390 length:339 start_codon:yes stop_codon:yes gene_type:complete